MVRRRTGSGQIEPYSSDTKRIVNTQPAIAGEVLSVGLSPICTVATAYYNTTSWDYEEIISSVAATNQGRSNLVAYLGQTDPGS